MCEMSSRFCLNSAEAFQSTFQPTVLPDGPYGCSAYGFSASAAYSMQSFGNLPSSAYPGSDYFSPKSQQPMQHDGFSPGSKYSYHVMSSASTCSSEGLHRSNASTCSLDELWDNPAESRMVGVLETPPQSPRERQMSRFLSLPREDFVVKNSFITLDEPRATKRERSCPPALLQERETGPTTMVMLRHLPNRATAAKVRAHLTGLGVSEAVSMQLPVDKKTGANRGYVFLSFTSEADARRFLADVEGTQLEGSKSAKRLTAVFAYGPEMRTQHAERTVTQRKGTRAQA